MISCSFNLACTKVIARCAWQVKREVMELLTKVAAEHRGLERHVHALQEKRQRMGKRKEAQERSGLKSLKGPEVIDIYNI